MAIAAAVTTLWCLFVAISSAVAEEPTRDEVALWQIALDRKDFSSGCIDSTFGSRTKLAIAAWQEANRLKPDGIMGPETAQSLGLNEDFAAEAYTHYTITAEDITTLGKVPESWRERAAQSSLPYETTLEFAAEKFHASQNFIRALNPAVDWANSVAGTVLRVPNVHLAIDAPPAAKVHVSLNKKIIGVFDATDRLIAFFPCSIGREKAKRPVGRLQVVAIAPNPNYTFDPKVFPESPEAQEISTKLIIPPGPNNPVGTMWISLSLEGYGIHGTPKPEDIGRTESHGCFRLANWNAERLARMISIGTPVFVENK